MDNLTFRIAARGIRRRLIPDDDRTSLIGFCNAVHSVLVQSRVLFGSASLFRLPSYSPYGLYLGRFTSTWQMDVLTLLQSGAVEALPLMGRECDELNKQVRASDGITTD